MQLGRVKQLLTETDFTLERISELSGFEHPEYMSVVFKRVYGVTPGNIGGNMAPPRAPRATSTEWVVPNGP